MRSVINSREMEVHLNVQLVEDVAYVRGDRPIEVLLAPVGLRELLGQLTAGVPFLWHLVTVA